MSDVTTQPTPEDDAPKGTDQPAAEPGSQDIGVPAEHQPHDPPA